MIILYVLKGKNGKRYVGITNDLERRIIEHRLKKTKAGQHLDYFDEFYTNNHPDYKSARKRENFLF